MITPGLVLTLLAVLTVAGCGARLRERSEALPQAVREHAWKAQLRLTKRYSQLSSRGVQHNKVCVAVARELAGFVWAIARQATAPTLN